MVRSLVRSLVAAALVAALGVVPAPKPTTPPITIVINGVVLPLQPPPRVVHEQLLVPVRRTIEALGLAFERKGRAITTQIGAQSVTLVMGSRIAHVDDRTVLLEAPPVEIHDVLYAPLRFFTDVLGAQATYDRKARTVTIVAQLVGRASSGIEQDGATTQRFGTVTAVDADSDPPTVTLGYNASVRTISIARNALIEMHDVNANVTVPGELTDVRPGDFARIYTNKAGHVVRVEDAFGSHNGIVAASAGDRFVLGDGHVIVPTRTTQISLNGVPAQMSDVRVGDRVTVRYNVETNEVRSILVSRAVAPAAASAGGAQIASVSLDADRPLRAKDRITVTLRGTPGGAATFDIGPYVTNVAMSGGADGTYSGSYTLPSGANFTDVPIIGHLRVNGANAPDVQADRTLSAASSPPGIADFAPAAGAVVNSDRPAIYATFVADAVAVNPSSVRLSVNGHDVTAACVRTESYVQYIPSFAYRDGPMTVTVRVADRAGNTTSRTWRFTIRARRAS
ncbi:MAG: copper amine oxidase N-terminal domain-containing protein [bacterium]|nr:copper amine oxidase N-terminal domain-containing protein [bacterium]